MINSEQDYGTDSKIGDFIECRHIGIKIPSSNPSPTTTQAKVIQRDCREPAQTNTAQALVACEEVSQFGSYHSYKTNDNYRCEEYKHGENNIEGELPKLGSGWGCTGMARG